MRPSKLRISCQDGHLRKGFDLKNKPKSRIQCVCCGSKFCMEARFSKRMKGMLSPDLPVLPSMPRVWGSYREGPCLYFFSPSYFERPLQSSKMKLSFPVNSASATPKVPIKTDTPQNVKGEVARLAWKH